MRTNVCITIDTEFSIAGAFAASHLKPVSRQMVMCEVKGRSEGLGFMLDCFRHNGITATFFVEALHRYYFKDDPMRPIVKQIAAAGHDLELHVHPCWSVFAHEDWAERVRLQPRQDDFAGRAEDDSVRLIEYGIEVFRDWGLARPTVFRSGSLQHDDGLYRALARCDIPYSSNIGVAIYDSGDPAYALYSGRHLRHGVVECPVLTFSDWSVPGKQHLKSLTITGTSFSETSHLLDEAHRLGIGEVVILTHPFEYIQSHDNDLAHARSHKLNQQRLVQLCEYLAANRDRFRACGMAEAAATPPTAAGDNQLLVGKPWQSVQRLAHQALYQQFGNWALAMSSSR
jgi:hypothetical protein